MSVVANTKDCWTEFIGQKVVAVIFDALPVNRRDLSKGNKTLIFEDGRGLTVSNKGTFWVDSAEEVTRAVAFAEKRLRATERALAGVLSVSGGGQGERGG